MKLRDGSDNKAFINICESRFVQEQCAIVGNDCPRTVKDKKGETSITYDVCVNMNSLESLSDQEETFPAAINFLNDKEDADLLSEYTLPKIKSRFKGDHEAVFDSEKQSALDASLFDGSKPPERYSGPVKRQEGTLVKSFKARYLLLQSGMLLVYKTKDDFTKNKSEMELIPLEATFSIGDVNGRGKKAPACSLYIFDEEDDAKFEMLLKFETELALQNWRHHLTQNLAYVQYKAAHLLF